MLIEKIESDLKEAMKQRDELKVSTLRFLKSAISYICIEKKKDRLEDREVFEVLNKQIKMRKDAIEGFKKGNREDLVQKEAKELDMLKQYLPEPLSDEEVVKIVQEEIEAIEVKDKSAFGRIMQAVLKRACGRADAQKISEIVKEKLNKPR
jgi:uncharacterized protein YqeY